MPLKIILLILTATIFLMSVVDVFFELWIWVEKSNFNKISISVNNVKYISGSGRRGATRKLLVTGKWNHETITISMKDLMYSHGICDEYEARSVLRNGDIIPIYYNKNRNSDDFTVQGRTPYALETGFFEEGNRRSRWACALLTPVILFLIISIKKQRQQKKGA